MFNYVEPCRVHAKDAKFFTQTRLTACLKCRTADRVGQGSQRINNMPFAVFAVFFALPARPVRRVCEKFSFYCYLAIYIFFRRLSRYIIFKHTNMKTSIKIKTLLFLTLVLSLASVSSCSKDRIDPEEKLSDYDQMDDYYDTKKQEEQIFEIDNSGEGPIIGNQGTKLWISDEKLMYTNGDSIHLPYTLKLIELYTPKDMIYFQMPTVSGGTLLTTGGEIRVRAFKNDEELVLRPNETWTVEMPNNGPESDMKIYYGVENTSFVDWTVNPAGNFNTTSYGYIGEIKKLGWIACGKDASNSTSTTNYSFTSTTDNLQFVSIFIYLPDSKSLMQVYNQTSGALPLGENIKIILMGINDSTQLFSYYQETQVSTNNQVDVTLTSISDTDLTAILDAL
jgi:hypothetical protein